MPSEQTIVLLGVEGSGKTTYLYRLVTSYLLSKGIRRTDLDSLDAQAFLDEARARGVTWQGSATEAFLSQTHDAMRDDRDIKLVSSEEAVPLTIGFTEYEYTIQTAEVPGSLISRTAHRLERGDIERGDEAVQQYHRYLRRVLRNADGVLFLHPPHEIGREVESEIVLRSFADLALRVSGNPFLPMIVVFTKAERWMPDDSSTQTRAVMLAGNPTIMEKRDRFVELYWQVLVAHHRSDLDHPFWRGITDLYRTGQNFAMISAQRDSFADLRAPLDAVVRLNTLQRSFFGELRRRNVMLASVGLFVFALGVLLALYLPVLFAPEEETRVPNFLDAQTVYTWLQDGPDALELTAALGRVDSNLEAIEPQLRGATGSFIEPTFLRYRDFLATLSSFKERARNLGESGELALARAREIEARVVVQLAAWMDAQRGGAERPTELGHRWVDAAEQYVDGLAPYLLEAAPELFAQWREEWQLKLYRELQLELKDYRESQRAPNVYVNAAHQLLQIRWAYLVEGRSASGRNLSYLPLDRHSPRYAALLEARRFIRQLHDGTLPIELHVDHFVLPNLGEVTDFFGRELRLEVVGGDVSVLLETAEPEGNTSRTYRPRQAGAVSFNWNVRQPPSLRIVDPDDATLVAFSLTFDQAVPEATRDTLPLPGFLPAAMVEMRSYRGDRTERRQLRFALRPPRIPDLLLYDGT